METNYQSFSSACLEKYKFTICEEKSYGYDQDGNTWQGLELKERCLQATIKREFPWKNVFFDNALIGCIQEITDGTWLALSPFYPPEMLGMQVYGFSDEFYAIRYLHQIVLAYYEECIEGVSQLPWEYSVL